MGTILVIGQAPDWRQDVEAFQALGAPHYVCAVNGAGFNYLDWIDYWVSVHGEQLVQWMPLREERGGNTDYEALGNFNQRAAPGVSSDPIRVVQRPNTGGSSGLFAVMLMLDIRTPEGVPAFNRVAVAGCPMEGNARVKYPDGYPGNCGHDKDGLHTPNKSCGFEHYRKGWNRELPTIKDKVRSMSGWTRELLGAPTEEWLRS